MFNLFISLFLKKIVFIILPFVCSCFHLLFIISFNRVSCDCRLILSHSVVNIVSLTAKSSDVQDISDDVLADVIRRLLPHQLQTAEAQGHGLEAGGGSGQLGQLGPLADGQTAAGLVGASNVLGDTLVYGLVFRGDVSDGEFPAGGDRDGVVTNQTLDVQTPLTL